MSEPDDIRLACIGCGTMNRAGAESCAGCGHRFAGPAAEPVRFMASEAPLPPPTELSRLGAIRPSLDDHFGHPASRPRKSTVEQAGVLLWKILMFLLALIALVIILLITLLTAFFISCGGLGFRVDGGLVIAWAMIGSGLIWIVILGLRASWNRKDGDRRD